MVGNRESIRTGKLQEKQIRLKLESLGFATAANKSEEKNVRDDNWGLLPKRFARHAYKYKSPVRPETACEADWVLLIDSNPSLHIESKNQTGGGSVAAKAVAACLELESLRDANPECEYYLVLPPARRLERMSPCDRDYFLWAMRLAKEKDIHTGDIGSVMDFLDERYRVVKKVVYK